MKKISVLLILMLVFSGCNGTQSEINIEQTSINFINDLSNGEYKKAAEEYKYTSEMKAIVNENFLKEKLWEALISTYGAYSELKATTASKYQGFDIISVTLVFKSAIVDLNIAFDAEKLIAGINPGKVAANNPAEIPDGIEEIAVEFGKEGWKLPGTLTVPKNSKDLPALVLVHGSGPNDRDETIGPNKPFQDIAWALAEKGIASLRYDKRTFVHQAKLAESTANFTVFEETVEDAILAYEHLKTIENIDSNRIYISGHSLGGLLIPRIAEKTPNAAGYIIMAGPVTPLEDLMVEQIKYLSQLDGSLSDEDKSTIATYEKMRNNVKNLTTGSDLKASDLLGAPSGYWLDLKGYNPAELAQKITNPLLIIQGSRDYQVPVREYETWMNELGARKNVSFSLYEGLNHLLIKGDGVPNPQEYNVPGHVDNRVIEDIANMIDRK